MKSCNFFAFKYSLCIFLESKVLNDNKKNYNAKTQECACYWTIKLVRFMQKRQKAHCPLAKLHKVYH